MKRRLILLCDYGLDDAISTLYILKNSVVFKQIDILPVGGNFPLKVSFKNACRLLANMEKVPKNITLVDTSSIPQPEESLPEIHGKDGMGDLLPMDAEYNGKVIEYNEWLKTVDSSCVILSLGPCTVTYDILKKYGALPLVLMGGSIADPPNYNGYEFNQGMDRKAYGECVKFEHKAATLDSSNCHECDFFRIEYTGDDLLGKMINRSVELSKSRNEKNAYIYDLVAAVYLLHPEKFTWEVLFDRDQNRVTVLKYIDTRPLI